MSGQRVDAVRNRRRVLEAADEPIWQRHLDLVLDSLRGKPPRNLLAPAIDRAQWDRFVRSTRDSWAE